MKNKLFKPIPFAVALASMLASGSMYAQIVTPDSETWKQPDSTTSAGSPPTPAEIIGNDKNVGYTDVSGSDLDNGTGEGPVKYQYKTQGSGTQTTQTISGDGVQVDVNTSSLTVGAISGVTEVAEYDIEIRERIVSYVGDTDPSDPTKKGWIDTAGVYGTAGTFYENGETLPGTGETVVTVRDAADGSLKAIIEDPANPGNNIVPAGTDSNGYPVLTQAQIDGVKAAGAPEGFIETSAPAPVAGSGSLTVEGQTTTNGIDNGGAKITNVADGTDPLDAVNKSQLDQEIADRSELISGAGINADGNQIVHIGENSLITEELGGQQLLYAQDAASNPIDINVTNGSDLLVNGLSVATDADVALEAGLRSAADTVLQNNIDAETSARILGDNAIRADFAAADAGLRNEFRAADRVLRTDIDKNTRGIAMVAAMTNTTIAPGMNHGMDFNVAQFQGATGFAFGYATRINENVQLHTAVASTDDFEESVGRIGISVQW